jgi:hypothetical protein
LGAKVVVEVHYPASEYKKIMTSSRHNIFKTGCPETILENMLTTHSTASFEENDCYIIEPERPLLISNPPTAVSALAMCQIPCRCQDCKRQLLSPWKAGE